MSRILFIKRVSSFYFILNELHYRILLNFNTTLLLCTAFNIYKKNV